MKKMMKTPLAIGTAGVGESSKIPTPTTGEVSLYFHLPFCRAKCPYCHFYVIPDREELKKPFLGALSQEWRLRLPLLQGKKIISIYFGGGTPTKIPPELLEPLILEVRNTSFVDQGCEITLEANPEDITCDCIKKYRALGINRISIGVQTFNHQELQQLGRAHAPHRAIESVEITAAAGISNISIDLMYELPKQTLSSWRETLDTLSTLPISHLSLYNLTFEPHTPFHRNQRKLALTLPDAEEAKALLDRATTTLPTFGLHRYEISAFAKDDAYSRHNTGYWLARPFLGFGPSAFSDWEGERSSNISSIHRYLSLLSQGHLPTTFREKLSPSARRQELLAIQLRLTQGVDLPTFISRHGPLAPTVQTSIEHLTRKGWLEHIEEGRVLRLTPEGQLFYDSVAAELI